MSEISDMRPFAFVLAVRDLNVSALYFREVLGFQVAWPEATNWRLVSLGNVRIMLGSCPNALPASEIGEHSYFGYLEVDEVDSFYKDWTSKGATIPEPPTERPYGMREFVVVTPDGHRFVVGGKGRPRTLE